MASLPLRLGVVPFGDITVSLPSEHVLRAPPLRHESNNKCRHCHAWTWAEESINCCSNGKYVVEPLLPLPPDIARLFQTRHFLTNQRRYNGLFSLLTQAWCNCTVVRTIASWTDSGLIILSNRPLSTKQECTCTMQNLFATQTVSHLSILSLSKHCRHR